MAHLERRGLVFDDLLCFDLHAAMNAEVRAVRPLPGERGPTYPRYGVMPAPRQDGAAPTDEPDAAGSVARNRSADQRAMPVAIRRTGLLARDPAERRRVPKTLTDRIAATGGVPQDEPV